MFNWLDYLLFIVTILLSLTIGIYHAVSGGKQRTTSEYLMADRKLGVLPVAVSITVSYLSAIAVLGNTSEMHFFGVTYWFILVGASLGTALAAWFALPLLYPLQLTSINEFLQQRYGSRVLVLFGWMCQVLVQVIYAGVVLYAPAVMLQPMSGVPVWTSILVMGAAATVYTTVGGLKGVIWTDFFQAMVILAGLLVIVIKGSILTGGLDKVWVYYREGGRLAVDLDPSPLARQTLWGVLLSGTLQYYTASAYLQAGVQRFSAVSNQRAAQLSLVMTIPVRLVMDSLACLCGVVTYAYFHSRGCDPLDAGLIDGPNQILPYFVMEVLQYPGVPGLFVACIYCGSLSSLSSSLSSVTAMTWNDILVGKFGSLTERKKTALAKLSTAVYGMVSIGFGFLLSEVGGTLAQLTLLMISMVVAPLFIVFVAGPLIPRLNSKSVFAGAILGMALSCWLSAGAMLTEVHREHLPTVTSNCSASTSGNNHTEIYSEFQATESSAALGHTDFHLNISDAGMSDTESIDGGFDVTTLYRVSHYWIAPVSIIMGTALAVLLSLLPGFHSDGPADPRLYFACVRGVVPKNTEQDECTKDEMVMLNQSSPTPDDIGH